MELLNGLVRSTHSLGKSWARWYVFRYLLGKGRSWSLWDKRPVKRYLQMNVSPSLVVGVAFCLALCRLLNGEFLHC